MGPALKIIPKINPIDQLENKLNIFDSKMSFSIFSSNNNYLTLEETSILYKKNTSIPIIELVTFKPQRILEHEIIISLTTTIKLVNLNEDLMNKFRLILGLIDTKNFYIKANLIRQEILIKYDIFSAIEVCNKILKTLAKDIVNKAILNSSLEPLTNHPLDKRITISITGPIASGKGIFKDSLMHLDSVKINGDSYKAILNPEYFIENSPKRLMFFSQLVQEEIHYLCREINKRLLDIININNKAPNVYLDKSFLNQQAIDIANINGGEIKAILISLPVSEAIKRSEIRGSKTGRYEDTYEILLAHNSITEKLINFLIKNVEKNISYSLYDNSIDVIEPPIKTADINLKSKKIKIYNETKFIEFLNKANIDIEESIKQEELKFIEDNQLNSNYFINQLYIAGYTIDCNLCIS